MPYIPQEQRPEIDVIVDPIVERISVVDNYLVARWLNYVILRIAKGVRDGMPESTPDPLDVDLDPLIEMLNAAGDNDEIVGRLNYALSRIMWGLCGHCGKGVRRYARMNVVDSAIGLAQDEFRKCAVSPYDDRMYAVDGAIGLAQAEFRRRMVAPYEDEKIETSGDIG